MTNKIAPIDFQTPYTMRNKILRLVWSICWTLLARPFPRSVCNKWNLFLLRCFGAKIAKTAVVYSSVRVFMPWNLEMRDYSCLGPGVNCYNVAFVTLGVNATVSQNTFLCPGSHDIYSKRNEQIQKPIIIGDRAWVAIDAFIGMGVTIGEGAVVGARAAVFKDVEPWTVVGGNPAKFIKKRVIKDE